MSHVDLMREGYARYGNRDFSLVDDLFAEDIDWRVPVTEPIVGRESVKQFFTGLTDLFASHSIALDSHVEDGDRLVCFVTHRFTTPDARSGEVEAVHDWRWRDGQVVSMKETADTMAFAVLTGQVPEPTTA